MTVLIAFIFIGIASFVLSKFKSLGGILKSIDQSQIEKQDSKIWFFECNN